DEYAAQNAAYVRNATLDACCVMAPEQAALSAGSIALTAVEIGLASVRRKQTLSAAGKSRNRLEYCDAEATDQGTIDKMSRHSKGAINQVVVDSSPPSVD